MSQDGPTVDFPLPTAQCPCGSRWFNIVASFDDEYEISAYLFEATCFNCNAKIIAPCPADLDNIWKQ